MSPGWRVILHMMPETCIGKGKDLKEQPLRRRLLFLCLRLSPQQLEAQAYGLQGNQTFSPYPSSTIY